MEQGSHSLLNIQVYLLTAIVPRSIHDPQQVSGLILEQVRAFNRGQQRSFFALRNSFKGLPRLRESSDQRHAIGYQCEQRWNIP